MPWMRRQADSFSSIHLRRAYGNTSRIDIFIFIFPRRTTAVSVEPRCVPSDLRVSLSPSLRTCVDAFFQTLGIFS